MVNLYLEEAQCKKKATVEVARESERGGESLKSRLCLSIDFFSVCLHALLPDSWAHSIL